MQGDDAMTDGPDPSTAAAQPGAPGTLSEPDRAAAVRRIAGQAAGGGLTLEEYAERVLAVEQAASAEEVEAAVAGLPEEVGAMPATSRRWLVAILGGTEQRGRWRLSRRLWILALFGGATLDLGRAQVEVPESVITVVALFGGTELLAPPGVPIQFSGLSLLGGRSDERGDGPMLPGSPLIRVRAFAIFGGVAVKQRKPQRNLLELIRSRRRQPPAAA
jgi:Domain of unknown function (DUF1707)